VGRRGRLRLRTYERRASSGMGSEALSPLRLQALQEASKVSRRPHSCPVLGSVLLVSRGQGFPCSMRDRAAVCPLDARRLVPTVGYGGGGGGDVHDQAAIAEEGRRPALQAERAPAGVPLVRWRLLDDDRNPLP